MPNYKSKGLRGKWSEVDLQRAFAEFKKGASVRAAAAAHSIPEKTLRDRIKKNKFTKGALGQPPVLGWEAENKLVRHLKRLQKAGFSPTRISLRQTAYNLAEEMAIPLSTTHFREETRTAGIGWLRAFIRRHPDLAVRKAQGVSNARAEGLNREEVAEYFALLQKTLAEHKLFDKPSNIYNVDESGLQLNNAPQYVIAEKGSKSVQNRQSVERGETITVVACCNSEGTFLPPYIIFKGKNKQQIWEENMPNGTHLAMNQKSAYINEFLFLDWLENHFIPRKSSGPCLLILDGHGSHTQSPAVLEKALENDVHFLCLPSHTSHFLQPLDRSFFKPLKTYFRNTGIEWGIANPGKKLERRHFGSLLQRAWSQAATMTTGAKGFRACGIFPFQPSAIPEYAFLSPASDLQEDTIASKASSNPSGTPKKGPPTTPLKTLLKDAVPSTSTSVITPSKILDKVCPVPLLSVDSSKKKQHAHVLTTPEMIKEKTDKRNAKAEKEKKKMQPKVKILRKPAKKKLKLNFEDELPDSSGGEWDPAAESSDECEISEDDFFDSVITSVSVDDFILVEFKGKTKPLYYVGLVTNKFNSTDIMVNFLKRGKTNQFVFPVAKDEATITIQEVKKVMLAPTVRRGYHTFKEQFPKSITVV